MDNEEIFKDQSYVDLLSGTKTPKFNGEPKRTGYVFTGWTPEVTETVTQTVTYSAQWAVDENGNDKPDKGDNNVNDKNNTASKADKPDTAVKTGDSTNVLLWSMATIISLTGVITALIFKRRRSR